jgi:hypothetical protein
MSAPSSPSHSMGSSNILHPHPTLPSYAFSVQQPVASTSSVSSSSSTAANAYRRVSSQSAETSTHPQQTPSTAPTTPDLTAFPPQAQRTWRPTSHVPPHITRRHMAPRRPRDRSAGDVVTREEDGDRNRWLSEDEGAGGGVSMAIGRRRRTSGDDGNGGGSRSGNGEGSRPSPIAAKAREMSKRPIARRAQSLEIPPLDPPSTSTSHTVDVTSIVGNAPPRIEDIVPRPSTIAMTVKPTSVDRDRNLNSLGDEHFIQDNYLDVDGSGVLASKPGSELNEVREGQRLLLNRLRRILGW